MKTENPSTRITKPIISSRCVYLITNLTFEDETIKNKQDGTTDDTVDTVDTDDTHNTVNTDNTHDTVDTDDTHNTVDTDNTHDTVDTDNSRH